MFDPHRPKSVRQILLDWNGDPTFSSERIELNVPVVIHRPLREGPQFSERTRTLNVSAHGALVTLAGLVAVRQRLFLQNIASGEQHECRVISVEMNPMGPTKVAVEFTRPVPASGA